MKVLVLGKNGMVAHMMYEYLKESGHEVKALSLRGKQFNELKIGYQYDLIVNCIGILVEQSEKDTDMAVLYNSYLPHLLEKMFEDSATKIIQISTDCIVDNDFYGRTKALGEVENSKDLTLRMSVIGPDKNNGTGLFHWFMNQKGEVDGYEFAMWNGITTLQLAKSIMQARNLVGVYNLVPEKGISKYDLLRLLNRQFNKGLKVNPVEMGKNKMLPPGDKIKLPSYETMIKEMKEWIDEHPKIYSYSL